MKTHRTSLLIFISMIFLSVTVVNMNMYPVASSRERIEIDGNPRDWTLDDVSAIDGIGETYATALDLMALYGRIEDGYLKVRVDLYGTWYPWVNDPSWSGGGTDYSREVNLAVLVHFPESRSTWKNVVYVGSGSETWTLTWDVAIYINITTGTYKYAVAIGNNVNWYDLSSGNVSYSAIYGMFELRVPLDSQLASQNSSGLRMVAYTINATANTVLDIAPNFLGATNDWADGKIDAYGPRGSWKAVPFIVVWHANQAFGSATIDDMPVPYAVINGKEVGLKRVIDAHIKYNAPFTAHFSGVLLSSMNWFYPDFIRYIRDNIFSPSSGKGTVYILTSTYGQSIMPWLPEDFNIWTIQKESELIHELFNFTPYGGWVPERAWKMHIWDDLYLAGIRDIILDPQEVGAWATIPINEYGVYATPGPNYLATNGSGRVDTGVMIEGAHRSSGINDPDGFPNIPNALRIFIINNSVQGGFWNLCVNRDFGGVQTIKSVLARVGALNIGAPVAAGSDMEIPAGKPYTSITWDPYIPDRYEKAIEILSGYPWIAFEPMDYDYLVKKYPNYPGLSLTTVNPGFESESVPDHFVSYGVPSDEWYYLRYASESPSRISSLYNSYTAPRSRVHIPPPSPITSTSDYRTYHEITAKAFQSVYDAIAAKGNEKLIELANYTLAILLYETAWCDWYEDPEYGNGMWLATWGRVQWAHLHLVNIIADAAKWSANPPSKVIGQLKDVDGDGTNEYVLVNSQIYAVFEREGCRLVFLATKDGDVMIGTGMGNYKYDTTFMAGRGVMNVEDYFNPPTISEILLKQYYDRFQVTWGFQDYFVWNIDGGYPLNNGSGGYFISVPYKLPGSVSGDEVFLRFVSEDVPETGGNEHGVITKEVSLSANSATLKVKYFLTGNATAIVHIGLTPSALDAIKYGNSSIGLHRYFNFNSERNIIEYKNDRGSTVGISWFVQEPICEIFGTTNSERIIAEVLGFHVYGNATFEVTALSGKGVSILSYLYPSPPPSPLPQFMILMLLPFLIIGYRGYKYTKLVLAKRRVRTIYKKIEELERAGVDVSKVVGQANKVARPTERLVKNIYVPCTCGKPFFVSLTEEFLGNLVEYGFSRGGITHFL
ncbi:MAG: hypothetical protein QXL15_00040, partial [Candidatus Korarchaeota archaeon]